MYVPSPSAGKHGAKVNKKIRTAKRFGEKIAGNVKKTQIRYYRSLISLTGNPVISAMSSSGIPFSFIFIA